MTHFYTHEQAENEFGYHPADADTGKAHDLVRSAHKALAHLLIELLPEGPLKTTAITTVRQAMWAANSAIATTQDTRWRHTLPDTLALIEGGSDPGDLREWWPVDPGTAREVRYADTDAGRDQQARDLRLATVTDDELEFIERARGRNLTYADVEQMFAGKTYGQVGSGEIFNSSGVVAEVGEQEGHADAA